MEFSIRSYCLQVTERVFSSPIGQIVVPHSERCSKLIKSGLSFKKISTYLSHYKYDSVEEWMIDIRTVIHELKNLLGSDSKFGFALDTFYMLLIEDLQEANLIKRDYRKDLKENSQNLLYHFNDSIRHAPNTRKELINSIGVAIPSMKPRFSKIKPLYYDNDDISEIRSFILDGDEDSKSKRHMMEIVKKFESKKHVVGETTFTFNFGKLSPYTIHLLKKYMSNSENQPL